MRISVTDKYSASSTYTNPIHKSLRKEIVWREVTELLLLQGRRKATDSISLDEHSITKLASHSMNRGVRGVLLFFLSQPS